VLQCVAVCCSVLPSYEGLHCVAVCFSVLQCVAVCCSVLLSYEGPCGSQASLNHRGDCGN